MFTLVVVDDLHRRVTGRNEEESTEVLSTKNVVSRHGTVHILVTGIARGAYAKEGLEF